MDDAAEVAGLGVTQFHERFHREAGYTPGDWRLRRRVMRAKQLLRQANRSVLDVAMASGFSSSQYFATAFSRLTGLSPSQYRRRLVEGRD